MGERRHCYPISHVRTYVEDGAVHLRWLVNPRYFQEAKTTPEEECGLCRIYRKAVGGLDESYANCCMPFGMDGAECVFEGAIAQTAGGYGWTDTPPQPAGAVQNYVYFVATRSMAPLELRPVAFCNRQMWWTYDELQRRLQGICAAHPDNTSLSVCGTTAAGREIPCLQAGSGTPALAIVGMVHAGESGSELMVPVVERLLAEEPDLMARARIILVPSVNIDNREEMVRGWPYYLRTNATGVDLNRNFPAWWETVSEMYGQRNDMPGTSTYRGVAAACAPETQAVMRALDDPGLKAVFSCHWLSSICAFPALSCAMCKDDEAYVGECRRVLELYSAGLYPEREYEEWFHGMQTTPGSLPAWVYQAKGIPAFDLEGGTIQLGYGTHDSAPLSPAMLEDYRNRHFHAMRKVLQDYICVKA